MGGITASTAPTCQGLVVGGWVWYNQQMNKGLYANINARRKAGISRSKAKSTISPRVYKVMKAKKGGFALR
jgi:hypothetical protein